MSAFLNIAAANVYEYVLVKVLGNFDQRNFRCLKLTTSNGFLVVCLLTDDYNETKTNLA